MNRNKHQGVPTRKALHVENEHGRFEWWNLKNSSALKFQLAYDLVRGIFDVRNKVYGGFFSVFVEDITDEEYKECKLFNSLEEMDNEAWSNAFEHQSKTLFEINRFEIRARVYPAKPYKPDGKTRAYEIEFDTSMPFLKPDIERLYRVAKNNSYGLHALVELEGDKIHIEGHGDLQEDYTDNYNTERIRWIA